MANIEVFRNGTWQLDTDFLTSIPLADARKGVRDMKLMQPTIKRRVVKL